MGMTGEQAYVLAKKYTEETAIGMGAIKGDKGDPGFSPTITESADNTDKIYKLDIETADGKFTTPNLKGADGTGGTGASTWSEISDKPFESLSTDFSVENGELKVVGGTGGSGEVNTIESISVNGNPISPDENKNVNITVPDAYDDTAISNRVKTIEDDYAKSSDIPSLSGYATESYVNEQISNIPSVDLTDYATKTYVGEQIANAEHLKREIITVLPSDAEASDNIIYMLKVESATGNDKYQEYMKIDGTVQMVGDTSVDLTDYAKKTDIPTTLPADGGNSDTVNNHTIETDVPADAVFTDTIYDDTEVKGSIAELSSNLDTLEYSEVAGGKNLIDKNAIKYGYELVSNGSFNSNSNWYVTNYVQVKPNTTYTMSGMSSNFCSEYDENKNFVNSGNKTTFTTNSNTKYVVMNSLIDGYSTPQLESGSVATEYEPYIPSVKMLADEVGKQNESLSVIGKCKNLINPTFDTYTHNGITFTKNDDGTYSLSGSRTDTSIDAYISFIVDYPLEKGRYKLTGALDENNNIRCIIRGYASGVRNIYDYGDGVVLDVTETGITITLMIVSTDDTSQTRIIKPMLTTDLNATYDDYVPYTGDGDTLTHDVAEIKNDLGGLTFSTSGTTLSVTDGTNTWTLNANS